MVPRNRIINSFDIAVQFCLLAILFFLPVSIAATNGFWGLCFFFWVLKRAFLKKGSLPQTPLNWLMLLLLAVFFVSFIHSVNIPSSWRGIGKLMKYFTLFFIVTDTINTSAKLKRLTVAGIGGLTLVCIDGLVQLIRGKDFLRGYELPYWGIDLFGVNIPRLQASMHNPNAFAAYLVVMVPLAMALLLYYPQRRVKIILGAVSLLGLFNLFNTFSRGASLGLVLVLVFFLVMKKDLKPLIVILVLVILFFILAPLPVVDWALDNLNLRDFFVEEGGRRFHWQAAINMIKAHPFTGVGINTFSLNYETYRSAGDPFSRWYAHSAYLQLAAETGVFGLIIFLSMVFAVIINWWKNYRQLSQTSLGSIALGFLGGFAGFLIAAVFESILQSSNLAVLFWYTSAVLISLPSVVKDYQSRTKGY